MLLSSWKWLTLPASIALATTTGAVLVGSSGEGDQPQATPTPVAAKVTPPPAAAAAETYPPRAQFYGRLTKREVDGVLMHESEDMFLQGTLADLAKTLEQLQKSDPSVKYRLRLFDGKLRFGEEIIARGGMPWRDETGKEPRPPRQVNPPRAASLRSAHPSPPRPKSKSRRSRCLQWLLCRMVSLNWAPSRRVTSTSPLQTGTARQPSTGQDWPDDPDRCPRSVARTTARGQSDRPNRWDDQPRRLRRSTRSRAEPRPDQSQADRKVAYSPE